MPFHIRSLILFSLFPLQQGMGLRHIMGMGGCRDERMNQARFSIHTYRRLHAEVPLVSLLGLMHLWIALTLLILGRGRRGDDRRIHHRAFSEQQAVDGQRLVDSRKEALGQLMLLRQATKLEQGRGIGGSFTREVNADKSPDGLTVVKGVFGAFVGETEALLGNLHSQHAFQSNRLTATGLPHSECIANKSA